MISPRQWLIGAIATGVLALAALAAATTAAQGMSSSVAGTTSYADPAGDAKGGPDVTAVTIDGDPATGTIVFTVSATGWGDPVTELERDVIIWIDTDRNSATGDPDDGTDISLVAYEDATGKYGGIQYWSGSDWVVQTPWSPTTNIAGRPGAVRFTVNTSDLRGATGFRFYVIGGIWNPSSNTWVAEDDAPNTGWWDYSITETTPPPPPAAETKVKLRISAPTTVPKVAIAGKRFTVTFDVNFAVTKPATTIDIGTGETSSGMLTLIRPAEKGTMVGNPSVAGRVIPHKESLKNGEARLAFVIPATAKGRLLKVKVKITATEKETGRTLTTSRIATFRVR